MLNFAFHARRQGKASCLGSALAACRTWSDAELLSWLLATPVGVALYGLSRGTQ